MDRQQYINKAKALGFDFSNTELEQEEQLQLLELLGKSEDIFATNLSHLGFTDCVTHKIDTGNAKTYCTGSLSPSSSY